MGHVACWESLMETTMKNGPFLSHNASVDTDKYLQCMRGIYSLQGYCHTSDRKLLSSWQLCVSCRGGGGKNNIRSQIRNQSLQVLKQVFLRHAQRAKHSSTHRRRAQYGRKQTEKANVEDWKKRAGEGEKRAKKKWNKNRLMMELVSRWGSPLTSEAPHSLAYPSPVKRRGHTADLSDCQGSSTRPSLSLSLVVEGPCI